VIVATNRKKYTQGFFKFLSFGTLTKLNSKLITFLSDYLVVSESKMLKKKLLKKLWKL
jgi:hypothetical protein